MIQFINIFKKNIVFLNLFFLLVIIFFSSIIVKNQVSYSQGNIIGFNKLLPTPAPYPINKGNFKLPELTANSIFIVDLHSGVVLYEKNADMQVFPASTTKLMTAIVALENFRLSDVLTVKQSKVDGNSINLKIGEQITLENLLYGMLIGSGNDAASAIADNFPDGNNGFVWAMNRKAEELNLKSTNFTNPVGLDQGNHHSTARNLASLASAAIKIPIISEIVSIPEVAITDVSGNIKHNLKNTNELVGQIKEVKGVKTGWTENAGECLITLVEKNGQNVLIVILGSQDRFGETKQLIDYIFNNFDWEIIAPPKYH